MLSAQMGTAGFGRGAWGFGPWALGLGIQKANDRMDTIDRMDAMDAVDVGHRASGAGSWSLPVDRWLLIASR